MVSPIAMANGRHLGFSFFYGSDFDRVLRGSIIIMLAKIDRPKYTKLLLDSRYSWGIRLVARYLGIIEDMEQRVLLAINTFKYTD